MIEKTDGKSYREVLVAAEAEVEAMLGVVKTWAATIELRRYDDTPKLTGHRLQQRWVCVESGASEWRDVPLVWEPKNSGQDYDYLDD